VYCLDIKAITYLGMIAIWSFLALAFLVDKRAYARAKWVHHMALTFLVIWCLLALIFGGFVERGYAIITIFGVTAVELLMRRRRSLEHDSHP
jgi:hypothetical protein